MLKNDLKFIARLLHDSIRESKKKIYENKPVIINFKKDKYWENRLKKLELLLVKIIYEIGNFSIDRKVQFEDEEFEFFIILLKDLKNEIIRKKNNKEFKTTLQFKRICDKKIEKIRKIIDNIIEEKKL